MCISVFIFSVCVMFIVRECMLIQVQNFACRFGQKKKKQEQNLFTKIQLHQSKNKNYNLISFAVYLFESR